MEKIKKKCKKSGEIFLQSGWNGLKRQFWILLYRIDFKKGQLLHKFSTSLRPTDFVKYLRICYFWPRKGQQDTNNIIATMKHRAGHFRYFLIFSITRTDFFALFIKLITSVLYKKPTPSQSIT